MSPTGASLGKPNAFTAALNDICLSFFDVGGSRMRHVYVTAWCDQAHVTRKLEGADGLISTLVDGPPFRCLRFLRMFSPQFAVSQKKEHSSTTSSDVILSVADSVMFKKREEQKTKGTKKKEMAWNVSETRSRIDGSCSPFVCI